MRATSRAVRVAACARLLTGLSLVAALAGCSLVGAPTASQSASSASSVPSSSAPSRTPSPTPTPAPTHTPTPTPPASPEPPAPPTPEQAVAGWTIEQQAAQVFMVGANLRNLADATTAALRDRQIANLFLKGRSTAGVGATRSFVDSLTALHNPDGPDSGLPMLVATDQEGGQVEVLSGDGFTPIPSAMEQSTWGADSLTQHAAEWGGQLRAAGVNVNLAPVIDVIPDATTAAANPPIGVYQRNYGFGEAQAVAGADAFAAGMRQSGVVPTFKHFPGLGTANGNTDTTAGVTDSTVTAGSPSVAAYRESTGLDGAMVMVSTAIYPQLDAAQPAAFSSAIIEGLLRGDVGFDGVVISDDLSAARAVEEIPAGQRAVQFVSAGGDIVLVSADPSVLETMFEAVVSQARSDPGFATQLAQAAGRVVLLKEGLR